MWPLRRHYDAPTLVVRDRSFAWGERTYVCGILNITPDSFSGDGLAGNVEAAIALALRFEAEGADLLDVGGESSRPGGAPVSAEQEGERVLPALVAIRAATVLPLSIDTYHASVAEAALAAGADIVNDISGLRADPDMAGVVGRSGAPLIAMHNQRGRRHHDVLADILAGFAETLRLAFAAGIGRERVILDPGFGFGWQPEQNLEMLRRLPELHDLRIPLLVGTSRKSTIGGVLDLPVDQRLEGSLASATIAIAAGADIIRVHDVAQSVRAARVADAIVRGHWRTDS